MVSYVQLSNMDTTNLTTAAEASGSLAGALSAYAADVRTAADVPAGMWAGLDAVAASDLLASQPSLLHDASDVFTRGRAILEHLVTVVETAKERLQGVHSLVAGTGITIEPDGAVTTPVVGSANIAEHNDEIARQARSLIAEAVRMVNDADKQAESALALFGLGDGTAQLVKDGGAPRWLELLASQLPTGPFKLLPKSAQSKVIGQLTKTTAEAGGADCKEINGLMTCVNAPSWMYERGGTTYGDTFLSSADSFEELESRPAPYTLDELIKHEKYHRDEQWRRYGAEFIGLYLAEESAAQGGENRYERAAEGAGKTGY